MIPSAWVAWAVVDGKTWPRPRSGWRALLGNLRRWRWILSSG